ncbi:RICIN domain-containing protein [Dactylosporangium sp. CA-233914]|uniref:RICIN domain-containing protein n=1 Tax=Dactylosporangium sp. CA-233914 TaxID=3239934 RepID=UPI003D8F6341
MNKHSKLAFALAAASVPVMVLTVAVWPSQAATTPVGNGVYTLAAGASGKCVDVVGGSMDNSALLVQVACSTTTTHMQWKVVAQANSQSNLANVNSGRCIDVPSASSTSGTQLQQYGCGDGTKTNQLWTFTASSAASGKFLVKSVATGLCISDKDGSTAGNNPIVEETCSDISRMQWSFNYVSGTTSGPTTGGGTGGRTWSSTADGFAQGTTGGAGGPTVTVSTYADLLKYATSSSAYVVRVNATITVPQYGYEIPVTSNKTIIGVGRNGRIKNGGFFLGAGVHNVIIRNLTIGDTAVASDDPDDKDFDYDGIQMDTADHVWIDHNTFTNINDGYIDSRKDTSYFTVSWNVLGNHNKTFGIGWTDNVTARATIHHNWFHDTNQRNPSADNLAYAHLYDNYLQNIASYGNYSRGSTKMVLENSYFDNVNNPYYPDSTAQLKQSGSIVVNSSGRRETSGSAFDPHSFYSYTLDPAADVPNLVKTYAGPQSNIGV